MAIDYNGSLEQSQLFANRIDGHAEEVSHFIGALQNAKGCYGGAVRESGTAAAIQLAFDEAIQKASKVRGCLLQAEEAMRFAGVTVNNADEDANAAIHASAYTF